MEQIYETLPAEKIKQITDTIDVGYDLIAVTLTSGDVLLGGLEKHWGWNNENIRLGFNTKTGKTFGDSHIAFIPLALVANVTVVPLADESIPRLSKDDPNVNFIRELGLEAGSRIRCFVQDYPNPLASVIAEHNLRICDLRKLAVMEFVEKSLSTESVPTDGIKLEHEFILYADWEFFSRQRSGVTTVNATLGVAGVSKEMSPSQQKFVFDHLKANFQRIKDIQDILVPTGIDEIFARGCILMPSPVQYTEIEGEKCILIVCANAKNTGEAVYPVLIKHKALKYPVEFLGQIRSPLVFYGELLPVPMEVLGIKQHYTILARAIGYLK